MMTSSRSENIDLDTGTDNVNTMTDQTTSRRLVTGSVREHLKLNNLPRFKGNPRKNERNFVPGIDVKTFFMAIENHCINNGITDDADKINLFYGLVDKESGNAAEYAEMIVKDPVSFENIKTIFIDGYLQQGKRGIPKIEQRIMSLLKNEIDSFQDEIVQLSKNFQMLNEEMFARETNIRLGITPQSYIMSADGRKVVPLTTWLMNRDLLRYAALKLPPRVYDLVEKIEATTLPSLMVGKINKNYAEHGNRKQLKQQLDGNKTTEHTVFELKEIKKCEECGRLGHYTKDCKSNKTCSYCKRRGHLVKDCWKKKKDSSYCNECDRKGHNDENCWFKNKKKKKGK